MEFFDDEGNREEARKMGLLKAVSVEASSGTPDDAAAS